MLKITNINYEKMYKILPFLIANTVVFTGCTGTIYHSQDTGVEANMTTSEDLLKPNKDDYVTVKIKITNLECMKKEKEKEKILLLRPERNQMVVGINIFSDGYIDIPEIELIKEANYQILFGDNLSDIVVHGEGETLIVDFSNYKVRLSEKEENTYKYV